VSAPSREAANLAERLFADMGDRRGFHTDDLDDDVKEDWKQKWAGIIDSAVESWK
jgi:hypothetical protein